MNSTNEIKCTLCNFVAEEYFFVPVSEKYIATCKYHGGIKNAYGSTYKKASKEEFLSFYTLEQ